MALKPSGNIEQVYFNQKRQVCRRAFLDYESVLCGDHVCSCKVNRMKDYCSNIVTNPKEHWSPHCRNNVTETERAKSIIRMLLEWRSEVMRRDWTGWVFFSLECVRF